MKLQPPWSYVRTGDDAKPHSLQNCPSPPTESEIPFRGFGVEMPKSSLSHHFGVPREAEIPGTRAEGTSGIIFLPEEEMERRFPDLLSSVLRNL